MPNSWWGGSRWERSETVEADSAEDGRASADGGTSGELITSNRKRGRGRTGAKRSQSDGDRDTLTCFGRRRNAASRPFRTPGFRSVRFPSVRFQNAGEVAD